MQKGVGPQGKIRLAESRWRGEVLSKYKLPNFKQLVRGTNVDSAPIGAVVCAPTVMYTQAVAASLH